MANEAWTEMTPPDRPRAPNAGGHGGDGTAQWTEGGDDTPRGASAEMRTADEVMTERSPPERPRALNASGRAVRDGREGTHTQRRKTRSEGKGGYTREDQLGTPHEGDHRNRKGAPGARTARGDPKGGRRRGAPPIGSPRLTRVSIK